MLTVLAVRFPTVATDEVSAPAVATPEVSAPDGSAADIERRSSREVIERNGGSIASDTGDVVVAYFGYPRANETDPQRAVRAALDVVAASRESHPGGAQARAAVHTGIVVVGTTSLATMGPGPLYLTYDDVARLGATPALAERLAAVATPGTVSISEATQQALGDLAMVAEGDVPGACEVLAVRDRRDPDLNGAPVRRSARLVGRDAELATLLGAFTVAREGRGRFLNVSGERGMGKSRLLRALAERLLLDFQGADRPLWLVARCSESTASTSFHPVVGLLQEALGIQGEMQGDRKLRRLTAGLRLAAAEPIEPALALLAPLLSFEHVHQPGRSTSSPDEVRQLTLELLSSWLLKTSQRRPVVLAVEDLEWSDPSSLQLLALLARRVGTARVLVVATSCRGGARLIEEVAAEGSAGHVPIEEMALDPLTPGKAAELVSELASAWELGASTLGAVAGIAEHSDGVPLFIEELVRAAATSGASPAVAGNAAAGVPATLESLLRARLDRVGPAKQVAQIAAAIGRAFSPVLLAAVCDIGDRSLAAAIEVLDNAGLVFPLAGEGGARHAFRYALIQDVAYSSMVLRRRKKVHLRIAAELESRFADRVEDEPEVLAYHLAAGGSLVRAAQIYERAGRRAARRASLPEAIGYYRLGLGLLGELPAGLPVESTELRLQILLGNALIGEAGPGAAELRAVWGRAIDLAGSLGDQLELSSALAGKTLFHYHRGDHDETISQSMRMIDIATWTGARVARLRGEVGLGLGFFSVGNPRAAREHLARAIALYRPGDFETVSYGIGHDTGVLAFDVQSAVSWTLGDADRALNEAERAVELAGGLPSALSVSMARSRMVRTLFARREHDLARRLATESVGICRDLGFSFWQGMDQLVLGNELARTGDVTGLELLDEAFTILSRAGSLAGVPLALGLRADAQLSLGDISGAQRTLGIAMTSATALGQPHPAPEMLLLQARLILAADEPRARIRAEEILVSAIESAHAHAAYSSELRSATLLGTLLEQDGRAEAAASALERVLHAIRETNVTPDQQDARELLARLRPETPEPVPDEKQVSGRRAPIRRRLRRVLGLGG